MLASRDFVKTAMRLAATLFIVLLVLQSAILLAVHNHSDIVISQRGPLAQGGELDVVWVMFGWTLSTSEDLAPYVDLYHSLGVRTVIHTTTNVLTLGLSEVGVAEAVERVLVVAMKHTLRNQSVVLQYFSDGGGVHHYALHTNKQVEFMVHHLAGTVFDSAPTPGRADVFANGLVRASDFEANAATPWFQPNIFKASSRHVVNNSAVHVCSIGRSSIHRT